MPRPAATIAVLAGFGGCVVSGQVKIDACQWFGGSCQSDADCCGGGLVCAPAGVCAYPTGTNGGSGTSTGAEAGASSGSTTGAGAGASSGSTTGTGTGATSASGTGSSSGATSSSGGSTGFVTAAHQVPQVPNHGGTVFASPVLDVVTYANDTNRATEEAFAAFLVQSTWLSTVGPEYGVGLGTVHAVELVTNAPGSIDDSGIQSVIASQTSGAALGSTVFMIFFPAGTAVSANGQALCGFASGYHAEAQVSGNDYAYAVIPDCLGGKSGELEAIESAAAHEFFEAVTDPFPSDSAAWVITDTTNPWHALGGELADLCASVLPQWSEGGYPQIARIYSNQAARAGGDPCLPAVGTYFGSDPEPAPVAEVAAGSHATFQITGWSTGPVAPWELQAVPYGGTFTPTLSLTATSIGNGGTAALTVGVPAGTASGDYALVQLGSIDPSNDQSSAFVGVAVP